MLDSKSLIPFQHQRMKKCSYIPNQSVLLLRTHQKTCWPTSRKFLISSQMRFFLNSVARSLSSQVCLFSVARLLRSQIFNTGPIHEQGEHKNFEFCKGIKAMEAICHRKLFKFPLWHQKFPPKSKISLQIICWSAKLSGCGPVGNVVRIVICYIQNPISAPEDEKISN